MPELHLKQLGLLDGPGFFYTACVPLIRNKERIEKFMQTGDTNYIYRNDLDKACFQHNVTYGKYQYLTKRTQADKVLRDKAFEIAYLWA